MSEVEKRVRANGGAGDIEEVTIADIEGKGPKDSGRRFNGN
jgi:hypothetical protein